MLSGSDASGKSTLAKALKKQFGFVRLSLDKMGRKEPDLIVMNLLEAHFYKRMRAKLNAGKSVVDDNMNLTEDVRSAALMIARKARIRQVWIVHLQVRLDQALEWNKGRELQANPILLEAAWHNYQENLPQTSEGPVLHVKPLDDGTYEVWHD
jgi:predicted kinase